MQIPCLSYLSTRGDCDFAKPMMHIIAHHSKVGMIEKSRYNNKKNQYLLYFSVGFACMCYLPVVV